MTRRSLFPGAGAMLDGVTMSLANPTDYLDRAGYDPLFIDSGHPLPLPEIAQRLRHDVAQVDCPARPGQAVTDLWYHHFSVVMRKSRRMPFYSCVNIDGANEQANVDTRPDWRRDPRVALDAQMITDGIYGAQGDGLFARGHMTRREDPNWGTQEQAVAANADTFHVTNACPQFQPFNSPIWLKLEDHVKNNAWADNMRIAVLTGPLFDDVNDPWYAPPGHPPVQVPVEFWKVVAFRHDDTGQLAATAYKASQAEQLPGRNRVEFVFGRFCGYQMRIADLEEISGLSFPGFREIDVLGPLGPGLSLSHSSL